MRKRTIVIVSIAGLIAVGGISSAISSANAIKAGQGINTAVVPSASTPSKPAKSTKAADVTSCMAQAVVTQVQLSGGFISTADVYTTLTGGFMSSTATGKGRQVVAAFQRCASTEDGQGLVTVYGADGSLVANGNF